MYLDIFKCCQISLLATTAKENPQIHTHTNKPPTQTHTQLISQKATQVTHLQTCASICNPPLVGKGLSTYQMSTLFILEYFPSLFNTYLLYGGHCQKMGRITVYNVRNLSIFAFQLYRISENYPLFPH